MRPIKSYVVRIYRQERRDIAGQVEEVRSGRATFFRSFGELWDALTRRSPTPSTRAPAASEPDPPNSP